MKHAIAKFIKLWKLEIRKSHYTINLSSPSSRAPASETTPSRWIFQFKKEHLWHNGHSWRSELKSDLHCGANYLWESKFHFFPQTRLREGRNNNSNISFNTNLAQRSMFLKLYTYDILSKWRSWDLHNNKPTNLTAQPTQNNSCPNMEMGLLGVLRAADRA